MLSEVLRKAYEEDRDICIFTKKNQTPAEKVAALALYKALGRLNRDTKVRIISGTEDVPYQERINEGSEDMVRVKSGIHIFMGVRTKTDLDSSYESIIPSNEVLFVIDAEGKDLKRGRTTVKKDFNVLPRNISKESTSMSVCQTVAMFLKREEILTPEISTLLLFGILKDTNNLREANSNVLEIVGMLMENGGDYQRAYDEANRKLSVGERITVSEIFRDIDFETLDNGKRIIYVTLDKETRKKLEDAGITDLKQYVQKLQEIEDADIAFTVVEKQPEKGKGHAFDIFFMKADSREQIDLEELASKFGIIRGTKNFAECEYSIPRNRGVSNLIVQVLDEIREQYEKNTQRVQSTEETNHDRVLNGILERTVGLSQNVASEDFRKVANLIREGADYSRIYRDSIPLRIFLLREGLIRSANLQITEDNNAEISLTKKDVDRIKARYAVTDEEILECISIFADTTAERADIRIASGSGLKAATEISQRVTQTKKLIKSAVVAAKNLRLRRINIERAGNMILKCIGREKGVNYKGA